MDADHVHSAADISISSSTSRSSSQFPKLFHSKPSGDNNDDRIASEESTDLQKAVHSTEPDRAMATSDQPQHHSRMSTAATGNSQFSGRALGSFMLSDVPISPPHQRQLSKDKDARDNDNVSNIAENATEGLAEPQQPLTSSEDVYQAPRPQASYSSLNASIYNMATAYGDFIDTGEQSADPPREIPSMEDLNFAPEQAKPSQGLPLADTSIGSVVDHDPPPKSRFSPWILQGKRSFKHGVSKIRSSIMNDPAKGKADISTGSLPTPTPDSSGVSAKQKPSTKPKSTGKMARPKSALAFLEHPQNRKTQGTSSAAVEPTATSAQRPRRRRANSSEAPQSSSKEWLDTQKTALDRTRFKSAEKFKHLLKKMSADPSQRQILKDVPPSQLNVPPSSKENDDKPSSVSFPKMAAAEDKVSSPLPRPQGVTYSARSPKVPQKASPVQESQLQSPRDTHASAPSSPYLIDDPAQYRFSHLFNANRASTTEPVAAPSTMQRVIDDTYLLSRVPWASHVDPSLYSHISHKERNAQELLNTIVHREEQYALQLKIGADIVLPLLDHLSHSGKGKRNVSSTNHPSVTFAPPPKDESAKSSSRASAKSLGFGLGINIGSKDSDSRFADALESDAPASSRKMSQRKPSDINSPRSLYLTPKASPFPDDMNSLRSTSSSSQLPVAAQFARTSTPNQSPQIPFGPRPLPSSRPESRASPSLSEYAETSDLPAPGDLPTPASPDYKLHTFAAVLSQLVDDHRSFADSLRASYEENLPLVRKLGPLWTHNAWFGDSYRMYVEYLPHAFAQLSLLISSRKRNMACAVLFRPLLYLSQLPLVAGTLLSLTDRSYASYPRLEALIADVDGFCCSVLGDQPPQLLTRDVLARLSSIPEISLSDSFNWFQPPMPSEIPYSSDLVAVSVLGNRYICSKSGTTRVPYSRAFPNFWGSRDRNLYTVVRDDTHSTQNISSKIVIHDD